MRTALPLASLALAFALLPAGPAAAQGADQQVTQLLQQAEQAYEQYLDIGAAQNYVDQAIRIVQQYGVTGNSAALAYALRGVIHVWMGEESDAVEMFKSALMNNPSVSVPGAWGGPDIDAAIEKARRQVGSVAPPPVTCPVGMVLQPNGTCAQPYTPPPVTCPMGMVLQPNGTCAQPYTPPPVTCPMGMVLQPNGTCAQAYTPPPVTCPVGMVLQPDGTCAQPYTPPPPPNVPMTRHTPVTEQLWNHPVPIYLEVNPSLSIGGVFLFYKSPSDSGFQRLEMARSGPGYYVEIACTMLQPGAWDYYIVVLDPSGNPLTQEGTQDRPFHINMVQVLSPGALYPTRPDGSTVADCGPDGTGTGQECPPGFPACHGVQCERSCTFNDDCLASEICMAGCCKVPSESDGGPETPGGAIGLFAHFGIGLGLGIASGTARETKWYAADDGTGTGNTVALYGPDDAYVSNGGFHLRLDGTPARQEVAIATGIALSGGAMRLGFGYNIIPELSISALFRFSFPFGDDFPWMIEGRVHYWVLDGPNHLLGLFAGGGAGLVTQMITKVAFDQGTTWDNPDGSPGGSPCSTNDPEPRCKIFEPYYKVSGLGVIAFGMTYIYKLTDLFGLGGEVAMDAMIPEFSFNIDITAQVMLTF
jgi:hypothetical protein